MKDKIQEEGISEENNVIESKSSEFLEPVQHQPSKQENQGEERENEDGIQKVEREVLEGLEIIAGLRKSEPDHFEDEEARDREDKRNERENEVQGEATKEEEKQTEHKEASSVHECPKVEEKQDSIGEEPEEKTKAATKGEKETEDKETSSVTKSPKVEEREESTGEATEKKIKPASSRRIKLCAPCVIAGSSIIVSLVVFAIHWIRSKKRAAH